MIAEDICKEYGLEVAASLITSKHLDKIANDLGFHLDESEKYIYILAYNQTV